MGGRLTSSAAPSSTATAHRPSASTSSNALTHQRTHSTSGNHPFENQTGTNQNRPRASSGQHRSAQRHYHRHSHGRPRTTSTNIEPVGATPLNLNILRYVGLNPENDDRSSDEDMSRLNRRRFGHFLFAIRDLPCPVCNKTIPSDSFDKHILNCLSKPRVDYNEDTLAEDKGECAICLEDLVTDQRIARLPCLCIYHKSCIDSWFRINRTCPEHPGD